MPNANAPYYPIIYVRGYAMSRGEIDETTADPFCGFNLGSTVYRATPDKARPPRKYIFESPVLRLTTDFGYKDVYDGGLDITDEGWEDAIPTRAIVIYRYYDPASTLLGEGKTPKIEKFAQGLSDLVLRVRDLVCMDPNNGVTPEDFRCYLVAHSMGGLVCRAFLQNPALGSDAARSCVDKFFTYATPHNGIDVAGMNVPGWLSADDISNFNRERMAAYLALGDEYHRTGRVDWLPERVLPSERVFCMVGTNRSDYEAAAGMSRTFVGNGSDGLVKIANASVWGLLADGSVSAPSATAYAYRSHSGYFGIVNSEEAYQNLTRFLFGDVRVDIWVDISRFRLPGVVAQAEAAGKPVNALYQVETLASPRGKLWSLTRRTAEEDSVACLSHQDWKAGKSSLYLSSVFLANRAKVDPQRASLAYKMMLGIRVPDYEVDRKLLPNQHYEGGYLFRDALIIELVPPAIEGGEWKVSYDWESDSVSLATQPVAAETLQGGKVELRIAFGTEKVPGVSGEVRLVVGGWNR